MLKQERIPTTTAGEDAFRSTNVINDVGRVLSMSPCYKRRLNECCVKHP